MIDLTQPDKQVSPMARLSIESYELQKCRANDVLNVMLTSLNGIRSLLPDISELSKTDTFIDKLINSTVFDSSVNKSMPAETNHYGASAGKSKGTSV